MRKVIATIIGAVALVRAGAAQEPNPKRWDATIAAFEKQDRKSPPPQNGIVFTGSSSIALWPKLDKAFPDFPVINRGFGGSTTADVNYFVNRIVLPYKPQIVVLYSGSNDIAAGRTPEQVLADFQTFVEKVHKALPATRIFYVSIHTPPGRVNWRASYQRANRLIADACAKNPILTFVDIRDLMLASNGKPNVDLYRDSLHPSARGYDLWAQRLTPLFNQTFKKQPK